MRRVLATCVLLAVVYLIVIATTYTGDNQDEAHLFVQAVETSDPRKYDAARAQEQRTRFLTFTCDQYNDVMSAEHSLSDHVVAREQRRAFLLDRNVSLCVSSVEGAVTITDALLRVLKKNADSADSLTDPCVAKTNKQRTSTTEAAAEIEHADYPGVYFHPSRKQSAKSCNLQKEVGLLAHKAIVVQHPMERLAAVFALSEMDAVAFADAALGGSVDEPLLVPAWQECSVCPAEFRPNFVIKREFLLADFAFVAKKLGLEQKALSLSEDSSARVSDRAKDFFARISKGTIRHLFELYRADHELFGYDPMAYINLGVT